MKPPTPKQVKDITEYWTSPPPERSERAKYWLQKLNDGWKPNRRIRQLGYEGAAEFFGVYIWEYINVLSPLIHKPLMAEKEAHGISQIVQAVHPGREKGVLR